VVELHFEFGILVGRFSNIVTKTVMRTRMDPNHSVGTGAGPRRKKNDDR
jgi:hypothetical protein